MKPGEYESHGNLTTPSDVDFLLVPLLLLCRTEILTAILCFSLAQADVMDERLEALDDLFVKRNGDNLK